MFLMLAMPGRAPRPRDRALSGLSGGPPFGGRAVGAGDNFHQMAVGVVEIEAAAAVEVVDLAAPVAVEIGVECDAGLFDARQRRVEFLLSNEKGVVLSLELCGIRKVQR